MKNTILEALLWKKVAHLDDYASAKVQVLMNKISVVAITHFVMRKHFTVQKEELLHTEHWLDVITIFKLEEYYCNSFLEV